MSFLLPRIPLPLAPILQSLDGLARRDDLGLPE